MVGVGVHQGRIGLLLGLQSEQGALRDVDGDLDAQLPQKREHGAQLALPAFEVRGGLFADTDQLGEHIQADVAVLANSSEHLAEAFCGMNGDLHGTFLRF